MTPDQPILRMNPPTLPDAGNAGYSQISIVEPGRLAFISGQVALTPDDGPVPADFGDHADLVIRNARAAIAAAGATPRDLVMVRIYMVGLSKERTDILKPRLEALFDGARPSVTGIGVAALFTPDLQLEIEMVVRVSA